MNGRIDHVGVVVADIADARRLLEDVLGLDLKREHHFPGQRIDTAFLGFDGGTLVELVQLSDAEERLRRLGHGNVARLEHIAIEVVDVQAMGDELQERLGASSGWTCLSTTPEPRGSSRSASSTLPPTRSGTSCWASISKDHFGAPGWLRLICAVTVGRSSTSAPSPA